MKRYTKHVWIYLIILLVLVISCNKDESVAEVEEIEQTENPDTIEGESIETPSLNSVYLRDQRNSFILYNGPDVTFEGKILINGDTLSVNTEDTNLTLGNKYDGVLNDSAISIFRTELPLVAINTGGNTILDDPKIASTFVLIENGEITYESDLGIEIRGGLSQTFPKQSYSIEIWEDEFESDTKNARVLGMRNDDDWILDGLWNEPLRIRDYTAQALWLKMGRYPYADEETITFGIERRFVELFINAEYRGIYYLSEKIDRKQLQLKKFDDDTQQVRGELFKGSNWADGTLFRGAEPFNNSSEEWSGYEAKYPDDIGELDWTSIYSFTDFVVNSDKADFDATISDRLDFQNMADYFIFLNVTYADDNWGKNTYVGRFDQNAPYFIVPWDLDATFGNTWTGERINITEGLLTENELYKKLLDNLEFQAELKSRWNTLRGNILATSQLQLMMDESYNLLKNNQVYAREALNDEFPFNYSDQEIEFIKTWIAQRMTFLDGYFSSL